MTFESPYALRDTAFNDIGASMAMIVASDSFLNDDQNLDLSEYNTLSDHHFAGGSNNMSA